MTNTQIDIQQWLEMKPYDDRVPSDAFYIKMSSKVKQAIESSGHSSRLQTYISRENIINLSCFLISYLEDIVSKANIWASFIAWNTELYQKPLPFSML